MGSDAQNFVVSKSVCVIGAGSSGLVAARELKKEGHNVVILEQKHDIGGQWLYDPNVEDEDPLGKGLFLKVHSSIYASLRTDSPREIMGFHDFPFIVKEGGDSRRFPGHGEVLEYLRDFCEYFGLRDLIRFNTRVEYVGMLNYKGNGIDHQPKDVQELKWIVRSVKDKKNHDGDDRDDDRKAVAETLASEEVFDAVVVANGHYSHPRLPIIKGMEVWNRKQMHSHVYRTPDPFRNEVVVVVGSSLSGQDISMELTNVAKEVHLIARDLMNVTEGLSKVVSKRSNLHLCPMIESIHEDGRVSFVDGHCITADTIIYATGYSYTFPFLDTKGIVSVDDNRVGPLYEHTFPPLLAPSLSFIGIPKKLIGFPFFESQAKWVAQLLSGKKKLPSYEEMMKSIEEFYHSCDSSGTPKNHTHTVCSEYCDKYADLAEAPRLEDWRKDLCKSSVLRHISDLENFRDSYDYEHPMLQLAYQSPHFTQFRN
ncbi:OLC1v1012332C1 [Oldenlandia corymbosa var. corymbosa]|uniref:Flavin-containing monooxygenase n=1 Tax=Oldenlandia corymbosa var. corymbosa TaxID=529605 RepID=A0AAV1DXW3_OLDCO|nr:OLC1v1012332C1 [Oldenlandia corymbosa var. corymbosa]